MKLIADYCRQQCFKYLENLHFDIIMIKIPSSRNCDCFDTPAKLRQSRRWTQYFFVQNRSIVTKVQYLWRIARCKAPGFETLSGLQMWRCNWRDFLYGGVFCRTLKNCNTDFVFFVCRVCLYLSASVLRMKR